MNLLYININKLFININVVSIYIDIHKTKTYSRWNDGNTQTVVIILHAKRKFDNTINAGMSSIPSNH